MQKLSSIRPTRRQALLALALFALVVLLFGAKVLFREGHLNKRSMKKAFGMAPAEVRMLNLRDATVNVRGARLGTDADKPEEGALDTPPGERRIFANLRSGRYQLTFSTPEGGALGECTLTLRDNDAYDFIAAEHGLAIVKHGVRTDDVAELDVLTSTLCRE